MVTVFRRHLRYLGDEGEVGEVGEYFGDEGDSCVGAIPRKLVKRLREKPYQLTSGSRTRKEDESLVESSA